MFTVGLVKELAFIALQKGQKVLCTIGYDNIFETDKLEIVITPDMIMSLYFYDNRNSQSHFIWREKVDGDDSFFGIESADTVSRIISCIQNNDSSWKEKYFFEK